MSGESKQGEWVVEAVARPARPDGDVSGAGSAEHGDGEVADSLNLIFNLPWVVTGRSRCGREGGDAEVDGRRSG